MNIITISREFGSGGRELGKRLADLLGYDYYDKEIISAILQSEEHDDEHIAFALDNHGWLNYSMTFSRSFAPAISMMQADVLLEQKKLIEKIAALGKDFVIVGRSADVFLKDYNPFKIFVCADTESKIKRCIDRAEDDEKLTKRAVAREIRIIDNSRKTTREIVDGGTWGKRDNYHLTVNTSEWSIKDLSYAVKDYYTAFLNSKK